MADDQDLVRWCKGFQFFAKQQHIPAQVLRTIPPSGPLPFGALTRWDHSRRLLAATSTSWWRWPNSPSGSRSAHIGDSHEGPLNNQGKPAYIRKKQRQTNPNTRARQTHTPTAHQTIGLATLGRNPASLEGYGAAPIQLRLARGPVAPSGEVPPRSRVGRPLERVSSSLGAGRPLERGPVSIESRAPPRASFCLARGHHGPTASIPAPPAGAFNALTFAGAQVKDESTPLRAWESRPGTAPPTPLARPSPPLCNPVRQGQQQPRGTVPPTPVRPMRCTLEKGRWSP
jgi:hypothetical protein